MKRGEIKKSFVLRQSNDVTLAIQNFTKLQRDCLYLIIQQININKLAERMKSNDDISYEIRIPIDHIKKMIGDNHPKRIADVFHSLVERVIRVYDPNTGYFASVSLISEAVYERPNNYVSIVVSKRMVPYFDDLANRFTAYSIEVVLSLASVYSQRFYEILNMFKTMGHFRMSVEVIKQRFCITGKSYDNFSLFRSRVLDIAKKELDEKFKKGECDLTFEYKPFSFVGKRVDEIEFKIIGDKQGRTSDYAAKIDDIMKYVSRVSGRNNDYLTFVKNSLAMLDMSKLEEIKARLEKAEAKENEKGEKLKGELIYYILKSDFSIDYRNQKQSSLDLINKKFSINEYLCEEEVLAYFRIIGLQKKSDILDYIKAKIDKDSKQFNDCEEYVKEVYYNIGEEWELKNTIKRKPESRVLPDDDELVNQEYPKPFRRARPKKEKIDPNDYYKWV